MYRIRAAIKTLQHVCEKYIGADFIKTCGGVMPRCRCQKTEDGRTHIIYVSVSSRSAYKEQLVTLGEGGYDQAT